MFLNVTNAPSPLALNVTNAPSPLANWRELVCCGRIGDCALGPCHRGVAESASETPHTGDLWHLEET